MISTANTTASDIWVEMYAIVLILVMLATNNPSLRNLWTRFAGRQKKEAA